MFSQAGKDPRILLLDCLMCGTDEDIVQHLLLTTSDSYKKGRVVTTSKWIYIPLCSECSEKNKSLNRKVNTKVDKLQTIGYIIIIIAIFSIAVNYAMNSSTNPSLVEINLFIAFLIPVGAVFLLWAKIYSKREYGQQDNSGDHVRFSGRGEVLVRPIHEDRWIEYNTWMNEVLSTRTVEDITKFQEKFEVKPPPTPISGKFCTKCDNSTDDSGNFCAKCGNLLITRRLN